MEIIMSKQQFAIKQEAAMLSRYVGLVAGRLLTAILSFLCLYQLSPACIYITLLGIFLPFLLQTLISGTQKKEPDWHLPLTLKKYHFTHLRYCSERAAAPVLLLFLLGWQYALSKGEYPFFWNIVPALLFALNIISRILVTILFRIRLHREFTTLKQLDE